MIRHTTGYGRTVQDLYLEDGSLMGCIDDESIDLIITSPPYNVGMDYETPMSRTEFHYFMKQTAQNMFRVLKPGGRACVNWADTGRKPYIPLTSDFIVAAELHNFQMRGTIIWNKKVAKMSTAWGSWRSASNPVLRDNHEYILVFQKEPFKKDCGSRISTIGRDEFITWTNTMWEFPAESAKRVGHPAPFPIELPRRLIQLYSFKFDTVLDPFMGSGTTGMACKEADRNFVGIDNIEEYVDLAKGRIDDA